MSSKNPLATTTHKMVTEGINEMGKKQNMVEKSITHCMEENDAINETDKTQASQNKKYKYICNESIKGIYHWIIQGCWINQGLIKELKLKT